MAPCACNAGKKFTVLRPNGTTYKTFTTRVEADAAAQRVGGTVKAG